MYDGKPPRRLHLQRSGADRHRHTSAEIFTLQCRVGVGVWPGLVCKSESHEERHSLAGGAKFGRSIAGLLDCWMRRVGRSERERSTAWVQVSSGSIGARKVQLVQPAGSSVVQVSSFNFRGPRFESFMCPAAQHHDRQVHTAESVPVGHGLDLCSEASRTMNQTPQEPGVAHGVFQQGCKRASKRGPAGTLPFVVPIDNA